MDTTAPPADSPDPKGALEARNALNQYRLVERTFEANLDNLESFRLTPDIFLKLHREATLGIEPDAGHFRSARVRITGSPHSPHEPEFVCGLVDEMCERANARADDAVKDAAYLLWKTNWIHPFRDGNGRTSRAVAHLWICVREGFWLPGRPTLTEYIDANRGRYIGALRDADEAWNGSQTEDVDECVALLNDWIEAIQSE